MNRMFYLCAVCFLATGTKFASAQQQQIRERDVKISETITLRVSEIGQGQPIIFVHGSVGDHTVWHEHLPEFALKGYRAISYSRRYNWPNENEPEPNHSAVVESDDLDRLAETLGIRAFHLVGHSYGAYTALLFALDHPDKIRTLILAEPPIVPWLKEIKGEQSAAALAHHKKLYEEFRIPAAREFRNKNQEKALRVFLDAVVFKGAIEKLPLADVEICRRNIAELQALVNSDNCYPPVPKDAVRKLSVPTLLVSGGASTDVGKYTDSRLFDLLPQNTRERVTISGANHVMWKTRPKETNDAVLEFIGKQ
ncbi:alpha/beta hydrolase [Stieleria sp. ICT_E10.1]|uniref:alpha/beta fold hydrolase n=1 Tax=Stieleria sedimenti TaxID=2976331 RepID=UPI00217F487C|nr:alpha/beta hydrolase [Stieleria sedimenti]MCS7469120.1 alpha/beta hydrolase [Stieleria sedimenti]